MYEQLKQFWIQIGFPVSEVPGQPVISFTNGGSDGRQWVFVGTATDDPRLISLFSRAPFNCAPERMGAMCELLVRLNYGMTHGAFDMDHSDGEIRFRTGFDLADLTFTMELFRSLALYNLLTMDHWLPALEAVSQGQSAEAAMAAVS